jgi:hypothetical protein
MDGWRRYSLPLLLAMRGIPMSKVNVEVQHIVSYDVDNAMTANYGDEKDDGVCYHESWSVGQMIDFCVSGDPNYDLCYFVVEIKCDSCGCDGHYNFYSGSGSNENEMDWE